LTERVAAERVAERVAEREQAGGHLPGYADLIRDIIAERKEAGTKGCPSPRE
jgi:hypothetical protein